MQNMYIGTVEGAQMNVLDRIEKSGIVPVVVLENVVDAVPVARALLAGGVDVVELTFRTSAAHDSMAAVSAACPAMLGAV